MTFRVTPEDLISYAAKLREAYGEVGMAKNYTHVNGDFSFHQAGIIGTLAGQHAGLMQQLDELHNQLLTILWRSAESLTAAADTYNDIDMQTAARVDDSYPPSPRPSPARTD